MIFSLPNETGNWLTPHEALGVLTYKLSLSFPQYRILCEWLDCYEYIPPLIRILNESALYIPPLNTSSSSFYSLWSFIVILENCYTSQEQSHIIREIQCSLITYH